jgi:hypothetical protein
MQIASETISDGLKNTRRMYNKKLPPPARKLETGEHEKESDKAKQKDEAPKLKVAGPEMMIDAVEKRA